MREPLKWRDESRAGMVAVWKGVYQVRIICDFPQHGRSLMLYGQRMLTCASDMLSDAHREGDLYLPDGTPVEGMGKRGLDVDPDYLLSKRVVHHRKKRVF